jgi:hypothetical protein
MSHPLVHAKSSARRFGGVAEDFLPIHDLLDSSKAVFPDNRHRALTHNSWFFFIVEKVFGHEIDLTCTHCDDVELLTSSCEYCKGTGKHGQAMTRYVCEQHVLEDFGNKFIPTPSDFLEGMEFQNWMNNGIEGAPSSHRKIEEKTTEVRHTRIPFDRHTAVMGGPRRPTRPQRFD